MDRQAHQPTALHLVSETGASTDPVDTARADHGRGSRRRTPGLLWALITWWVLVLASAVLEFTRWGVVLSYVVGVRVTGAGPLWVPRAQWLWHGLTIGAQGVVAIFCLRAALRVAARSPGRPRRTALILLVTGAVLGIAVQHAFDVLVGIIAGR